MIQRRKINNAKKSADSELLVEEINRNVLVENKA